VRGAIELIGLFIAPTTFLVALAYYFGWTFTNARASYFGIDPSTLGFSTQDYVLRSTDALFVPLAVLALAALTAVATHSLVKSGMRQSRFDRAIRWAAWLCGAIGAVLLALGVVALFWPLPFPTYYLFAPVSPGLGALLLAYAVYISRGSISLVAVGLVLFLVALSAFWAVSKYADALGRGRANELAQSLSTRPGVAVYSRHRLQLGARQPDARQLGLRETRLPGDSTYDFQYTGLRLLVRSGGNYFLVPDGWSRERGFAIVLRDSDELRLELTPGR
jgi:hypothetical protein